MGVTAASMVALFAAQPCSACIVDRALQRDAADDAVLENDTPTLIGSTFPLSCDTAAPLLKADAPVAAILVKMEQRIAPEQRGRDISKAQLIAFGLLFLVGNILLLSVLAKRKYREIKRFIDIIGSIVILSLFSPLMLLIAVLIKIDSPGPVLIRQVRVGLNRRRRKSGVDPAREKRKFKNYGSLFLLYKFRTMHADAEAKTGPVWAKKHDDRITRIGTVLRKTHLDELPQFVNVLKGDMCIVGPRPERPLFTEQLRSHIRNFDKRLQVKPGITGLAQVRYRYAASVADTRKKLKYDLLYINKMCITMDLRILFNTFNMLVTTDKGAR